MCTAAGTVTAAGNCTSGISPEYLLHGVFPFLVNGRGISLGAGSNNNHPDLMYEAT